MQVLKFQPKSEKAMWKFIYDVVEKAECDKTYTYQELESLTGIKKEVIQSLKRKVDKELLENHNKMLICERKTGYRVSTPQEQIFHATHRHRKARRQIKWGNEEILNIDIDKLSAEEKIRHVHMLNFFKTQYTNLCTRSYKAKKAQDKALKQQQKASIELASMSKLFDELGKKIDGYRVQLQ